MSPAIQALTDTRTLRPVGKSDGAFFVGRPDWLTGDLLADLQQEAKVQRESAVQIRAQYFGELGPVATALAESPELSSFITEHAAPAEFSGEANYRYYDIPHSQVPPHLDSDAFAFNLLIMLSHEYVTERRSGLLLFPHGPEPVSILMEPGEIVLFHASRVVHARTPVSDNNDETAGNLGIGFRSTTDYPDPGYWSPDVERTPA